MKRFRWILLLTACWLCGACGSGSDTKDNGLTVGQLSGTWRLKSWTGEAQNPDGTSYTFSDVVYVYMELGEDNTFTLYQNVSTAGAAKFSGTYSLNDTAVSGYYLSGSGVTAWSDSYTIGGFTANSMIWTAVHAPGDVQEFVRVDSVPQEVLDAVNGVRSAVAPSVRGIL